MTGGTPGVFPGDVDDRILVARSRAGDLEAFGALVRRYQDRLYGALVAVVGNEQDALDIAQEAFVRAFGAIAGFRRDAAFYTWLYRIAFNVAASRRRKRVPGTDAPEHVWSDWAHKNPSTQDNPVRRAEEAERARAVRSAIAGLEEDQRGVIVLRELEGLSYAEIARVMGVEVGTVKSRLHRARKTLAARLQGIVT